MDNFAGAIVKICGIRTVETALAAADAGVDMLGYNFYPLSKRYITIAECTAIQNALIQRGYKLLTVGVFVNSPVSEVRDTLSACNLDLAQLAGDEPSSDLVQLGERAFKAIRPTSLDQAVEITQSLPGRKGAPQFLVDANLPGEYGGTGHQGDWAVAAALAQRYNILLAGGLTPDNVARAIAQVKPWGVDVASGAESAPGVKDSKKIKLFIHYAKNAEFHQE